MSVFSFYFDCKAKILSIENYDIIESTKNRILFLFNEIKKLNQVYYDCSTSKKSISELCSTLTSKEIKKTYQENIKLFENTMINTRDLFINAVEDINQLISIFVNLMISNDYSTAIKILTQNFNEPAKEKFFLELENIYKENIDEELLEDIFCLMNSKHIINYQYQLEVALIMVKPKGSIVAEKSIINLIYRLQNTK